MPLRKGVFIGYSLSPAIARPHCCRCGKAAGARRCDGLIATGDRRYPAAHINGTAARGRLGNAWRTIRHMTWPNCLGSEPVL